MVVYEKMYLEFGNMSKKEYICLKTKHNYILY